MVANTYYVNFTDYVNINTHHTGAHNSSCIIQYHNEFLSQIDIIKDVVSQLTRIATCVIWVSKLMMPECGLIIISV